MIHHSSSLAALAQLLRGWAMGWLLALCCVTAVAQAPAASSDKGVLVLLSSGFGQRGIDNYVKGLYGVLNDRGLPYTRIHIEYLDLVKNPQRAHRLQLAALLSQKYPAAHIGVIVTMQSAALGFLLDEGAQIAPGAPVMVAQAKTPPDASRSGRQFFNQTSVLSFAPTLQLALDLFPKTQNVFFLSGSSPVEMERLKDAQDQFAPWQGRLKFEFLHPLAFDEMARRLSATPANSIIIAPGVNRDSKGQVFVPVDTIVQIAKSANAPVFPVYSVSVGLGAIGGMVSILEDEGKSMALTVLNWLQRTPGEQQAFNVNVTRPVPLFDWTQLERWGANASRLPENTVYLNRPPSLWGQYKAYVVSGTVALALMTSLVIALALQNRRRTLAERSLRDSQKQYQLLTDHMDDVLWVMNLDTRKWDYCCPSVEKLVGFSVSEVTQQSFVHLMSPEVRKDLLERNVERLAQQQTTEEATPSFTDTLPLIRKDGTTVWTESVTHYVRNDKDQRILIGVTRDVTQRVLAQQQIDALVSYDTLTQLPNRRNLQDRMHQARENSFRNHTAGALLVIDLDNFKALNDTRGHEVGDQLLRTAAQRLNGSVRAADTVARIGGDEFVVLLENLDGSVERAAAEARAVAAKILTAFQQDFSIDGQEHHMTASIGITMFKGIEATTDDVLKQADLAMGGAKAAGRNTMRFFDPQMQAAVSARALMETDLRKALQNHEFVLLYQPQVDAKGDATGAEALIRWLHPVRGVISPADFITVAEETGLILPIGEWVLETACAQLHRWAQQPATSHLTLAVNVSPRQFRQDEFVAQVTQTLRRTDARADRLKLELTEGVLLDNVNDAIYRMMELKSKGVGFSLDDFGTGFSSLSYLKRLPLDQLKIDKSFIDDVLTDSNDAAIARTIVALGKSLGLRVIAEGVETEGQRAFLEDIGCLAYQGYLFSRPLGAEGFERFLDGRA